MATLYGNSTGSGYWRLEIDYAITEYPTYYYINLQAYRYALKKDTSGYDARTDTTSLYAYNQSGAGNPTWNHANSAGQRRWLWGWAANIWKTTYAYTASFGGTNTHPGSHTMSGSSSASGAFTVAALQSWAVTYNANGTNVSGMPANGARYYTTTYTIPNTIPTRTGYTFVSWNTAANGTGTTYNPGQGYASDAALTLYAQWTPKTFTIQYNSNTGSGTTMANSIFTYDQAAVLRSNTYTKTDNIFIGWADTASATIAQYADGADVRNIISEGSKTLYAIWKFQFGKPNIITTAAERASLESNNSNIPTSNPFGKGAFITATINLGTKENPYKTINPTYTKASASCVINNNTVRALILNADGSPQTNSSQEQYEYLITPSGTNSITRTWYIPDTNNLNIDYEYVATISVTTLRSQSYTDVAKEGGASNGTPLTVTQTARVPIGAFLLDAAPEYDSIGLFTVAPDINKAVLIGMDGDIWLELDDNSSGTIDAQIINGIETNYWDVDNENN